MVGQPRRATYLRSIHDDTIRSLLTVLTTGDSIRLGQQVPHARTVAFGQDVEVQVTYRDDGTPALRLETLRELPDVAAVAEAREFLGQTERMAGLLWKKD